MENSYRYFKNEQCKYYPCHKIAEGAEFNCLFCYCPLNPYEDCPGTPEYIESAYGKRIKNCANCTFPHQPENYEKVVQFLKEKVKGTHSITQSQSACFGNARTGGGK